ncbi:MAG: hypothetical protein AB4040_10795 [Synechococcus sp.]
MSTLVRQLSFTIDAQALKRSPIYMGSASRYWRFVRIDAAGKRKIDSLAPVKTFFQQQFADSIYQLNVSDEDAQCRLVQWMRGGDGTGYVDRARFAEICLRCFISNAIEQVCVQLEKQFGSKHGFSRYDLFPFVLDDTNPLRDNYVQRDRPPLPDTVSIGRSRPLGETQSVESYRSSIDDILQNFDPERGSLTTWTVRLVRRHRELNAYLLECGVYLISDWAILNDTSPQQVRRILSDFHTLTEGEIVMASTLLAAFHAVYRQDRLEQRRTGSTGRCHPPSEPQLRRMADFILERSQAPKQQTLGNAAPSRLLSLLQELAERLRQYRIHARGGPAPADPLDGNSVRELQLEDTRHHNDEREEQSEFLTFYRQQFSHCMDRAIADTIERWVTTLQRKKTPKHQQFLQALALFHEQGLSMGEIAPKVGLQAQYQVSRLLKLKELRADIRQSLLLELRERVMKKAGDYHSDLGQLQAMDRKIEAALSEQVDNILHEAAAEASVAQRSPVRSLYTRRLCQYLNSRSQTP